MARQGIAQKPTFSDPAWRYQLRKPVPQWAKPDFDDSHWREGMGGFGTPETPGARVGTEWDGDEIWMRRWVLLDEVPSQPGLLIHHDEDAEVFLNGELIAEFKGYTTEYRTVPIDARHRGQWRVGENLMAVHCTQRVGGQFIDAHLIDMDKVPSLPKPQRRVKPFVSELITPWGKSLKEDYVWQEYPRPALVRGNWKNLNGWWDYAIAPIDQSAAPDQWKGKILVPFSLESKLSGVQELLHPDQALWYRTTFDYEARERGRSFLNFEGVDYHCQVWLNERWLGEHTGGNTPFRFEITKAVKPGRNLLVVQVKDATEGSQLRGKQTDSPRGIWYTQVSGIWQTVWVESTSDRLIDDLKVKTDGIRGSMNLAARVDGSKTGDLLRWTILDGTNVAATKTVPVAEPRFDVQLPNARRWSPDDPYLYSLKLELLDAGGAVIDQVESYAGVRSVGKVMAPDGHLRFTLNGKVIFHLGPLDQGWWPDGLLTPPSDEAMLSDIRFLKEAGFNMIRKHIKVEPRRYYTHCDRIGMMVWQDQVSGGKQPKWTRLEHNPTDAVWDDADHQQFMQEFEWMVDGLENHPSIVVWTPFNEAWAQHRTMEVGTWIVGRDPSRLVNIASGGNFWPVGDIIDEHRYPHPGYPFQDERDRGFIKVVGEFGGHGLVVPGHIWNTGKRNWGYGGLPKDEKEYRERYVESVRLMAQLKSQGIAAGVYTQTTDVEGEVNGLITYDREVKKLPASELKKIHQVLFD
jgi:beta-galactosidase